MRWWLFLSSGLLTLAILTWVGIGYSETMSSTSSVVTKILESRANTFTEMFVQRDLEQFLSSKNAGGLTRVSLSVKRAGRPIAQVGTANRLGLSRSFEVPTVASASPYVVSIALDVRPVVAFYLVFLAGILVTYQWMLKYSLASFNRSTTAISGAFAGIIRELRGESTEGNEASEPLREIVEIRQLSDNWKAQLEQYREELTKLSTAEAQSKLAQQVAHDIKSPLSVLRLILALKKPIGDEERAILVQAGDRISRIADDMLILAKESLERSRTRDDAHKLSATDLRKIWFELAEQKKIEYPRSNVQFNFAGDDFNGRVAVAELTMLKRVISNLMNNSLNAAESAVTLTMGIAASADTIKIWIEDDGPGIPPEILYRLSEQPFSLTGTGMGVSSAFRWMRQQGGRLEIASTVGGGTTVSLIWPLST